MSPAPAPVFACLLALTCFLPGMVTGRQLLESSLTCTPMEERPLLASCRYFQSSTYAAVKAGNFPAEALLTNRLSLTQACEIGCLSAIQRTPCFADEFKKLAQNICFCRAQLSNRCKLGLDEVLPVAVGFSLSRNLDTSMDAMCGTCQKEMLGAQFCLPLLPSVQNLCFANP